MDYQALAALLHPDVPESPEALADEQPPRKLPEGAVRALIVFGPCRFFGLFGRGEDYYIPWECIQKFGDDIILIDKPFRRPDGPPDRKRRRWG